MPVTNLSEHASVLHHFLAEIRDEKIQADRGRFRFNMERCGYVLAYEISREFQYSKKEIKTPLGIAVHDIHVEQPVIGVILRAGIPLFNGIMNFFEDADAAFIAAYRKHQSEEEFEIALQYLSCPDLNQRVFILADPMLATGRSMVATLNHLLDSGIPKKIYIAAVISARKGIENVLNAFPEISIYTCAIDEELNSKSYIVPGLGDAGDLAYGLKIQH
jgi:uracil phosphoribosyltransferase